jgi:hypothetical protein
MGLENGIVGYKKLFEVRRGGNEARVTNARQQS